MRTRPLEVEVVLESGLSGRLTASSPLWQPQEISSKALCYFSRIFRVGFAVFVRWCSGFSGLPILLWIPSWPHIWNNPRLLMWSLITLEQGVSTMSMHQCDLEGWLKHRELSSCFKVSGEVLENQHLLEVPRGCWCWPGDHPWRTTTLEKAGFLCPSYLCKCP